jgi:hypothetical protein
MPQAANEAYAAWKRADDEARSAENRLKEVWEKHDRHQGPPPSAELMAEISLLRSLASDRLKAAMKLIGSAAK